ncbi:hypothetical protein [Nocardia brasiliensis]|uniref:hypothetical protein n=1 Tax=Nocardia brasiliensis TaxID=37326 RepID=UPI003D770F43
MVRQDAIDEIIVVDNGSTDDTAAVTGITTLSRLAGRLLLETRLLPTGSARQTRRPGRQPARAEHGHPPGGVAAGRRGHHHPRRRGRGPGSRAVPDQARISHRSAEKHAGRDLGPAPPDQPAGMVAFPVDRLAHHRRTGIPGAAAASRDHHRRLAHAHRAVADLSILGLRPSPVHAAPRAAAGLRGRGIGESTQGRPA